MRLCERNRTEWRDRNMARAEAGARSTQNMNWFRSSSRERERNMRQNGDYILLFISVSWHTAADSSNPILKMKRVQNRGRRNVHCVRSVCSTRHETRDSWHIATERRLLVIFVIACSLFQLQISRTAYSDIRGTVDIHSLPLDQLDLCAKEMILWYGNQNGCNSIFFLYSLRSLRSFDVSWYFAIFCRDGVPVQCAVCGEASALLTDSIFLIFLRPFVPLLFTFFFAALRQTKKKANCNLFLLPIATTKAINF